MPKYKKETLEAMQREKNQKNSMINVDYIKDRYKNNNPITKEEIEETFKNAFKDIFKNIFESEIESELGYTKYDYKNKRLHELKLQELEDSLNNESNEDNENSKNIKYINNSRNGYSKKILRSNLAGDFEVEIPRDRIGKYEPILIPKYQRDISTFEDKILAMYAKGMSTEAINNFMEDMYKINISAEQVSRITDKIIPLVKEWQNRPLQRCYPIIFLDGMVFDVLESGS
ncbi:MAG TPA: transposase [Rickettsiales bacterium]|nr:transposase [Rickettsiales bacterium]